jgi:hypothetical protein
LHDKLEVALTVASTQPMTLPKPKPAESRRRIDSQKSSKFSKNGFDLDVPTLIISGVVLFVVFFVLQVVLITN